MDISHKKFALRATIGAIILCKTLFSHALGSAEIITYGLISGWACLASNPDYQPTIIIKRDDGHVLGTTIASNLREEAVKSACNSRSPYHGFSFSYLIAKKALVGTGNPKYWHRVHVFLQSPQGDLEELHGSPKNLYFGDGIPTANFGVDIFPPQDFDKTPQIAPKSLPLTVWPNNIPPSNLPYYPPASWPCGHQCPAGDVSDYAPPIPPASPPESRECPPALYDSVSGQPIFPTQFCLPPPPQIRY